MIDCLYDCFKHWAARGSVYLISDLHFNDSDCKSMDQEWLSPEEHVAMINKNIYKSDTLVVLGDVGDPNWMRRIKAKKILVAGNHDTMSQYRDIFDEIYEGPIFIAPKILLSHEPIQGLRFCVNIHGHDHGNSKIPKYSVDKMGCKHINVASNVIRWMPVSLQKEIKAGAMSNVVDIHRITIDKATKNAIKKKARKERA